MSDAPCRFTVVGCSDPAVGIWYLPAGAALGDMTFIDPVQALCEHHASNVAMAAGSRLIALLDGIAGAITSLVLDRPVMLCQKCGGTPFSGYTPADAMATAQCPNCNMFHAVPWGE